MKKKTFLSCSYVALSLFLLLFIYVNFIKRTKGFCLKKILSYHDYDPNWDLGPPSDDQKQLLDQINSQPFYYLGSGKECYAFVSQDKELVIKFFKQKHLDTRSILKFWPFSISPHFKALYEKKYVHRSHLRHQTFMSYFIAYHHYSDRTGVLYLHLNKTKDLKRKIEIFSPKNELIILDLDSTEFLVQRRADYVFDYLEKLLNANQLKEAKQAIGSILDLIINTSKNGIFDDDTNCQKNIGFIGKRAYFIDVGEFRLMPARYPSPEEFYSATYDLMCWLKKRDPELLTFLEVQIQKRIRHDL